MTEIVITNKDKEKAEENFRLYNPTYTPNISDDSYNECYKSALQMAKWKEQQIIDKACEWWKNELTYPTMTQAEIDWYKTKIEEFKKAMKK